MPRRAVRGTMSFSIWSRTQAPVRLNSRFWLPLRRASATMHSARGRRLGAPPHHAILGIGTAEPEAEKSAPPERRPHALACSAVLDQRARHKPAESDQAGIERFWAIGYDMGSHHRMDAVGADQEVAIGAGAVRKVRDHALIGAVVDADQ